MAFGVSLRNKYIKNLCVLRGLTASVCEKVQRTEGESISSFLDFSPHFPDSLKREFMRNFKIQPEFIREKEENSILLEIEPLLKRMRYEFDHWDDAIHGFREKERMHWNSDNSSLLDRLKTWAFDSGASWLPHVHILDLHESGRIKPHIDNIRFCGDVIAGVSLLSDSVMEFKLDSSSVKALLQQRSAYMMQSKVRYQFTHQILSREESIFRGRQVDKRRRISLICRSEPD